jgi:hypothetical protein
MTKELAEPLPLHKRVAGLLTCIVDGCSGKRAARGFCQKHYVRFKRTGTTALVRKQRTSKLLQWVYDHANHDCDECLIWPFNRDSQGYPGGTTVNGKTVKVHRVMCEIVNGVPSPRDLQCCHVCGNGHLGCINPRHLRWGTALANSADKIRHGRSRRGESHWKSRLTVEQVVEIKKQLEAGRTLAAIAKEFNVPRATIGGISERRVWHWLNEQEVYCSVCDAEFFPRPPHDPEGRCKVCVEANAKPVEIPCLELSHAN